MQAKEEINSPQWGTIEIAGLKFADSNLGIDEENPYGKLYSWNEAMKACPSGWRILTYEEWANFRDNTTHKWVENREAISGMKFTDKVTGNSIFLPAMGYYKPNKRDILNSKGNCGYYWSSTCHASIACLSYGLGFGYDGYVNSNLSNNHGYSISVRCVQDIENEK